MLATFGSLLRRWTVAAVLSGFFSIGCSERGLNGSSGIWAEEVKFFLFLFFLSPLLFVLPFLRWSTWSDDVRDCVQRASELHFLSFSSVSTRDRRGSSFAGDDRYLVLPDNLGSVPNDVQADALLPVGPCEKC